MLRRQNDEAYQDFKHKKLEGYYEKRWMWRVSDILPVSM
jgi:hypothetical protein